MKVIGLGAPDEVRVAFDACELDVLVDILRAQRTDATRDAADTYAAVPDDERAVDGRHDRIRGIEGLLIQLEEQPPENAPGAILVGETGLMREVVRDSAREALRRLDATHERYENKAVGSTAELLSAAETAKAWTVTLTAIDRVDLGWDA